MAGLSDYQMLFQLDAKMGSGFSSAFTSGANSVQALQNKIEQLNRTQGDIAAYQKQQQAIEKTQAKLQLYQQQMENLKNATAENSKQEADLANSMLAKQAQIDNATKALEAQQGKLGEMGQALNAAGVDTGNLASEQDRLKAEVEQAAQAQAEAANTLQNSFGQAMQGAAEAIAAAGLVEGLKDIGQALMDCSSTAAEFETAMAGVKRTVGGDDNFIRGLGESFKQMSTEMPITANDLAGIATTAGQLGIAQDDVLSFTTVMAQLATTTDLTADTAATMLAQFANITGLKDYDRLGSVVAQLGDATATTASKVVQMSQGMAASASIAGFSERDILAVSAAVGSLGIEAQAGSTSMSQLIQTLYKAVETGDGLENYAAVANMSASQFATAWRDSPVMAMNAFVQGLNDVERNGRSAIVILDELGITNVRQTKAILGLASSGDLLANTVAQANAAWEENTALGEKAEVMYNTTEARMTMMQNAANNVQIAIGDALNPALSTLYDAATALLQPIAEFIEANPAIVQGLTAFVGVLGTVVTGIMAYSAATKLAAVASKLFAGAIPHIGIILGVAAAVGVLVAAISAISGSQEEASQSLEELNAEFEDLQIQVKNKQAFLDMVNTYEEMSSQANNLKNLIAGGFDTEIVFTATAEENQLTADDFISDTQVELTATQIAELYAAGFMVDGDPGITISAQQVADLYEAGFLAADSPGITLTAEQAATLHANGFMESNEPITLTAEQTANLVASGFLSSDDTGITLTAKQTADLVASGFLAPGETSIITLSAEAIQNIKASDFVAQTTVQITATNGNVLTAEDFGISDKTLLFIAQLDDKSMESVRAQAEALKRSMTETKTQLNDAEAKLKETTDLYNALESKLTYVENGEQKSALEKRLGEVGKEVEDQTGKVAELQRTYTQLQTEYVIAATAANELVGHEQALVAVKEALSGASGGVITASAEEAEAFDKQAAAAKAAAEAQLELLKAQQVETVTKGAKKYAESLGQMEGAQQKYNLANQESIELGQQVQEYQQSNAAHMRNLYNEMMAASDSRDFDTAQAKLAELRDIIYNMPESGGMWLNGIGNASEVIDRFAPDISEVSAAWTDAQYMAAQYSKEVEDLQAVQTQYLTNMASLIEDGTLTASQAQYILEQGFVGEEDAAVRVQEAMDQVNSIIAEHQKEVEEAADASKEYSDATEEAAEATNKLRSIEDITEDMKKLGDAYDATYKSALQSMNGQFELFEHAQLVTKSEQSVGDMKNALDEQKAYIKQYKDNYKLASDAFEQAGVSQEVSNAILANLADGSTASAEYLVSLANASEEELQGLADSYASLQASKEEYARTVAEIQTDFTSAMATLQSELDTAVANMDMSSEAASAAASTMSAFANTASSYSSVVYNAFKKAADEASAALATVQIPSAEGGVEGNAHGTSFASPGIHLVGEEGPELVLMRGGEKVLTAAQTAHELHGVETISSSDRADSTTTNAGTKTYSVNVSCQIDAGGMDPQALENLLVSTLAERLEDALANLDDDQKRRALA